MELKQHWRIQSFDVGQARPLEVASAGLVDRFWITATVPGDVHSALIERKIIDNPYPQNNGCCRRADKGAWGRNTG